LYSIYFFDSALKVICEKQRFDERQIAMAMKASVFIIVLSMNM